ncbi:MAG: type II secretion system secretin GspD [Planctomycetota bacterium]|nr:type II secretion system secretin GspD [Planctomycetota bacterium]
MFRIFKHWLPAAVCLLILISGSAAPSEEASTQPNVSSQQTKQSQPEQTTRPATTQDASLRLNFKDASVHAVLEYLSEAAGLVILEEARVDGRVTVMSRHPIDTSEAVSLLDSVLKEKGYTAIRRGRTLKIVTLEQAKKSSIPVHSGNDPEKVKPTDKLITQVIPIRFADAVKLKTDLASLKPAYADLSSNAASNALMLTATQADVRRFMEIIKALDGHMAGVAEVKVFQLQYANATNTAKLITDLFKQDQDQAGRAQLPAFMRRRFGASETGEAGRDEQANRQARVIASADDRTNTVVVSAPPDILKAIEGIIKELDSNPSAEQAVFIYPLKNAQAKNMETVLNQIFSETSQTAAAARARGSTIQTRFGRTSVTQTVAATSADLVGQVYVVADEDTNSLLVRTATKHFDRVKEILAELDRPIRQVLIKILIAEVTHDKSLDLGTEFSVLNLRFGATGTFNVGYGANREDTGGLITATVEADLSNVFAALQRVGRLDVLSRPYILASDNQEAAITVGQEVPFPRQTRTTETGQTITTIQYEDVGIILTVTPHVNPEGLVIMDVSPEISTLTGTTVPISDVASGFVVAKRSAQTRVAVSNGQTIVIGGLMEDRITDEVRKVPIIGDIPLLNLLFRRTIKSKVKTELLIFLTPHVAKRPEDLKKISDAEKAGSETLQKAVEHGAFDKHLKGMQRGATSQPAGEEHETQP